MGTDRRTLTDSQVDIVCLIGFVYRFAGHSMTGIWSECNSIHILVYNIGLRSSPTP